MELMGLMGRIKWSREGQDAMFRRNACREVGCAHGPKEEKKKKGSCKQNGAVRSHTSLKVT